MITISERYEAQDLDPLCEGWHIGVGRDKRLDRSVILARYTGGGRDTPEMSRWLTRRAALSHTRVAQMLDLYQGPDTFVCVFEGGADSRFGLPNLPRVKLLQSCRYVVDGVQALAEAGVNVPFVGGQVLWDGGQPKVLGLPLSAVEAGADEVKPDLVQALGKYFGSLLEWHLLSLPDQAREELPAVWSAVMRRLLGEAGQAITDLSELGVILQTLEELPDVSTTVSATTQPGIAAEPRQKLAPRRVIIDDALLSQEDDDESYEYADEDSEDFDEFEDDPGVTYRLRRRLLPFAIGVVAVAVILLLGGITFSHLGLFTHQQVAAPSPTAQPHPAAQSTTRSHPTGATAEPTAKAKGAQGQPTTDPVTSSDQQVATPVISGQSTVDAIDTLLKSGIPDSAINVVGVSSGGSAGEVLRTSLAPGQTWTPGETVSVFVSVPQGETLIPDLVGMSVAEASQVLLGDHLHYSYQLTAHAQTPAGDVFAQSPGAYAVTSAQTVDFQVAAKY
ncbi:MAG: PASTA domain-containing protein [Firmicutes bacterium]|nr:PASTA domain-containing protein [Bacillota bacterium]